MKCVWCGKEFESERWGRKFCGDECRTLEYNTKIEAKRKFRRIAKKYYLKIDIKKMIDLTQEKVATFKKDYIKCTKYPNDEKRYCVSPKCLKEIKTKGECRCGLFKERNVE